MTYSYLIKSSTNIKSKSNDLLLYKTKIRDISWITDFCDNIDLILQKTIIKKQSIIDEIINVDCDFSSNVDFDYQKKEFVSTIWVFNLIDTSEFRNISSLLVHDFVKDSLKKKVIWEIVSTIYERAKYLKLDYLQKLSINWISCWCIDNWVDICLMLPDEY